MKHNFIYLLRNNNITISTTNKTKFWINIVQMYVDKLQIQIQ